MQRWSWIIWFRDAGESCEADYGYEWFRDCARNQSDVNNLALCQMLHATKVGQTPGLPKEKVSTSEHKQSKQTNERRINREVKKVDALNLQSSPHL